MESFKVLCYSIFRTQSVKFDKPVGNACIEFPNEIVVSSE